MVESRQVEDEGFMYGDDVLGAYIQDADILDHPDLFYGSSGITRIDATTSSDYTGCFLKVFLFCQKF